MNIKECFGHEAKGKVPKMGTRGRMSLGRKKNAERNRMRSLGRKEIIVEAWLLDTGT